MKLLSEAQLYELANLSSNNPREALKILSEYKKEYADDGNLQENLGGFLIDIGSAIRDISVIQSGVNNIEQKRKKKQWQFKPHTMVQLRKWLLCTRVGQTWSWLHIQSRKHHDDSSQTMLP